MHPKWIIALALIFLIGTALSGVLEAQYLGGSEGTLFRNFLERYKEISFGNPFTGFITLIQAGWDYLVLVWRLFWFDYSYFYGTYEVLRWFFWVISIGIIVSLILAVTRGTSSA